MKKTSAERRANARTKASVKGLPLRITRPNGAFQEIIDFEGSIPIYFTTTNANAAIATGASPMRTTHSLDGSGGGPFVIAATDSTFSGTSSITGPIYSNWQGTEFTAAQISAGDAAPTADADKDGLSNLAEYALGTDPNTATVSPSTAVVGGSLISIN